MSARRFLLGLVLLGAIAAPLAAQDDPSDGAPLERRLRACLTSGSAGAPRDSLEAAVVAVRSLCYTQIRRVREFRLAAVDASYGLPEAQLTAERQDELERARDLATRKLNDEIALAIAEFTGLQP
jgi:hypothetical protein